MEEKMFRLRDDLKAIFSHQPPSSEEIEKSVSAIDSEFPKDLKEFYKFHDGGWLPAGVCFDIWEFSEDRSQMKKIGTESLTAIFCCQSHKNEISYLEPYTYEKYYLQDHEPYVSAPGWLKPFGMALGRNQVCFSTRGTDSGQIFIFWVEGATEDFEFDQEEYSSEKWVGFVAADFQSFLSGLRLR
jgi:cell wall assembly regulator SMI1